MHLDLTLKVQLRVNQDIARIIVLGDAVHMLIQLMTGTNNNGVHFYRD